MRSYFLSVGSNVGDRLGHLRYAAEALPARGVRIFEKSSVYESAPWGNEEQASFLNAVFFVGWEGSSEELLRILQSTENARGRRREVHWGPRTLDLDIIFGFDFIQEKPITRHTKELTIPHPLYRDRAFVLVPLAEVAPDFPWLGVPISSRIEELNGNRDVRLFSEIWE